MGKQPEPAWLPRRLSAYRNPTLTTYLVVQSSTSNIPLWCQVLNQSTCSKQCLYIECLVRLIWILTILFTHIWCYTPLAIPTCVCDQVTHTHTHLLQLPHVWPGHPYPYTLPHKPPPASPCVAKSAAAVEEFQLLPCPFRLVACSRSGQLQG